MYTETATYEYPYTYGRRGHLCGACRRIPVIPLIDTKKTYSLIQKGQVSLLGMAAKDVGRSESVPKRPRISSVHSETADLRQRLESSFPLDALLPTLHLENVLTDYEFNQLLPTPQSALVHRNRRFLDYLGNKDPSTISDTLSVLFRPEYETYGYFGEMLRQLFGVEGKEREGMRENTSHKPQPKWERGRGAKEVSRLRSSHLTS